MFWCELCQGRLTQHVHLQSGHVDLCTEVYGVPPRASDHLASGGPPVRTQRKRSPVNTHCRRCLSSRSMATCFLLELPATLRPHPTTDTCATNIMWAVVNVRSPEFETSGCIQFKLSTSACLSNRSSGHTNRHCRLPRGQHAHSSTWCFIFWEHSGSAL